MCPCGKRSFGLSLVSYAPRAVADEQAIPEFYDPLTYWDISIKNNVEELKLEMYQQFQRPYLTMLTKPVTITS